ncbi:hypothetical protein [Streptococcus iniae]|uniref:hypothetical protein n=1 Tax=Streptococcus iniae TaxID=1346 RepID=UPI000EF71A16|nr:hypothetical protein [Streptococcus iniae]RLU54919.1 hypothetical protein DIY04_04490 [Streptococcus iniae]RLU61382.1 hypothetical protein DIY02_04295 [Streptococcus iniae]RLU62836.1 hypothetical protein DIY01_04105 [Streptococcus iniae]RLU71441.1 hypothetical protein DIX97_04295 [Streptococcus iniae]RLU85257.1 hypothetical protein DIX91_04095 [Streptococcus iniae]
MEKNLSIGNPELGKVTISNVVTSKIATIQSASISQRFAKDGEPIQGSIGKIACNAVDSVLAKVIEKSGADISSLKPFTLELVGDEEDLREITVSELIGSEINIEKAKVMLKWVSNRNSSGWRDLKVVLDITETESVEEK